MALPFSFSNIALPANKNNRIGPFQSAAGNLYVLLNDSTNPNQLEMWKGTDSGGGVYDSWAVQGTNPDVTDTILSTWAVMDGTDIHVATIDANFDIDYHVFSVSSDSWTTSAESAVILNNADNAVFGVSIAVRSDGDVVIAGTGNSEVIKGTRYARVSYWIKPSGGSWGAENALDDAGAMHYQAASIVLGASDKIHMFFLDRANGDLLHKSLTSGDSLSGAEAVNDATVANSPDALGAAVYYDAGGTERITVAWVNQSDEGAYSAEIDNDGTPGAAEAITTTDILHGTAKVPPFLTTSGADDIVYAHFVDASTTDIWHDSNDNSGGWGTDVETLDAVSAVWLNGNTFVRGSDTIFGYVFDDNGTIKYNEYTLVSGGATVGDTLNGTYNVADLASDTLQGTYNVADLIGDTLQGTYNVADLIGDTLQGTYNVADLIGDTLQGTYDVDGFVGDTLQGTYNVADLIGDTLQGTYDVFNSAGDTLSGTYNVAAAVGDTLAGTYNVFIIAGDTLQGTYNVADLIGDTLSGTYNVAAAVGDTLQGTYNVADLIGDTLQGTYDVDGFVGDTLQGTYNVADLIGDTLSGTYDVFISAGDTLSGTYNVADLIGDTLSGTYDVDGFVGDTLQGTYNVAALIGDTLSGTYDVFISVGDTLQGTYNVADLIGDTLAGTYDVFISAGDTLSGTYNVAALVGDTLSGTYNVAAAVGDTLQGTYNVADLIGDTLSGTYHVAGLIGDTLSGTYNVAAPSAAGTVSDTLQGTYNVADLIGDTLSGTYDVFIQVGNPLRTVTVIGDDRTLAIPAENRTAIILQE